jgi:hypothetical protein
MPPTGSKSDHLKIREELILLGVSQDEILGEIYSKVFPWYGRIFDKIGVFFGAYSFNTMYRFIEDLAESSSGGDIEAALYDYHNEVGLRHFLLLEVLGLAPRRSRVFKFYRKLRSRSKNTLQEAGRHTA